MVGAAPLVLLTAVVVYAALAVLALRNRLLARVAVREAIRRPAQSALLVAGLTVGTGAILGPQIWGDSLTDSLAAATDRSWARVDITVSAGGAPFSADVAEHLAANLAQNASVTGVQAGVDLMGTVSNPDQQLDDPNVLVVGFDPAAQPAFGAYVLDDGARTYGDGLGSGEVILSRSLADSIRAHQGDRVVAWAGGRSIDLTVAGIASPVGPGLYGLRPALFAPLSTASALIGSDRINVIRITATGDGAAEAAAAHEAAPIVRAALASLAPGPVLEVREAKAEEVAAFTRYENESAWIFVPPSLLALIIGSALVVNLILSVADERRPRLAVLRALGLSRSGLVTLSLLEGGIYSLAAAALSLVTGTVIAWLLFGYSVTADLTDVNGRDVVFEPSIRPGSIVTIVAIGALVTMLTVLAAAVRTSRMAIASAIRDLPDRESTPRRSWLRLSSLILLTAAGILGLLSGDPRLRLFAGLAIIVVGTAVTRGQLSDRIRTTVAGVLVTAWGLAMLTAYGVSAISIDVGVELWLLGAATTVVGLALMVAGNLRLLESLTELLGRAASGLRATLRPPLAYMTRRPMRTGLTIGVIGLSIAAITIWTLVEAGGLEYDLDSGGFDIEVIADGTSALTLPAPISAQIERSVSLATYRYLGKVRLSFAPGAVAKDWRHQSMPLYEITDAIARGTLPRLSARDARFASDAAAFRAVASDPTWVIANWWGGSNGTVSLYGRDGPVEFKVAGTFAGGLLDGVVGSHEALAQLAGSAAGTTLLAEARSGVDADALARVVRQSLLPQGVQAFTTKSLLDQGQVQGHTWSAIFRLMAMMALVAGVLSLGVLALRSVLERRRAIGILRALGWQPRQVLAGVLIEATLITGLAIVLGVTAGLEASYFIHQAVSQAGPDYGLDGAYAATTLVTAFGVLMGVTVLVTIGPAIRASRMAPIDALRLID
jgi:putative ABC transport system permease protein